MTVAQLAFKSPPSLPISEGETSPNLGAAKGAKAWSTTLLKPMYWSGTRWIADDVLRINPSRITNDTAISSYYNATSTGPITVKDGITITISDYATWSIT